MTSQRPSDHIPTVPALTDLLHGPTSAFIEELLDASTDGMAILGPDGELLIVNAALAAMYATTTEALVGQPSANLIAARFRNAERRVAFFADPQRHEAGIDDELCAVRTDGTEFPIELRLAPLRTAHGPLVQATFRDATARKRHEESLLEAVERASEATQQLQELDRMKAEFISTASHELRTPLTVVMGFARMLSGRWDTLDDATRVHLVKRIAASGQRLEGLIADMIDFTRAEAGRIDVTVTEQQLDELAHDAAYKIRALLDGHELRVDVPPGIVVLADRAVTNRIFENLLTNAVRYSPEGTSIVIDVLDPEAADEITVRVIDDGPGIPPDERERVFERYYRAGSGPDGGAAAGHGTGIGLAITKAFAEAQGGRIWVDSGELCGCHAGSGSCFCFTLRRAASA